MFTTLFILVAAATCSINGVPFEAPKPQYDPNYFLSPRIVGGQDAPEGYGKHMAALVVGRQIVSIVCGGSIVTKRHILTAAHCIEIFVTHDQRLFPSFRGIIGTKIWSTGTNEVQFIRHVIHSEWNWITIKNDIGLLTVAADIHPSDSVAIMPVSFDWVDGGAESHVTGWGLLNAGFELPEKLQMLYVWTLCHDECVERMRIAVENTGPAPPVEKDVEICTLHSPGHGMCNGDSGSGMILKETQKQVGIVSWGFACALGHPDVFVRLSGFADWMHTHTGGLLQ